MKRREWERKCDRHTQTNTQQREWEHESVHVRLNVLYSLIPLRASNTRVHTHLCDRMRWRRVCPASTDTPCLRSGCACRRGGEERERKEEEREGETGKGNGWDIYIER